MVFAKILMSFSKNAAVGISSEYRFLWVAWFDFEQGLGSPERAWFAASRFVAKSEGLERSEVLTRRGRTSVPAINKPRQDP